MPAKGPYVPTGETPTVVRCQGCGKAWAVYSFPFRHSCPEWRFLLPDEGGEADA